MKMGGACELFQEYREREYPVDRPIRYKKSRTKVTFEPKEPHTPWYLDAESGGLNPPLDQRKEGIRYED